MIFKPELAAKVLDGSKTMTRRQKRPSGVRYHAGREYAVQPGRGKFHICHIRPYMVATQRLGEMTTAQAAREGFPNVNHFLMYWAKINGPPDLSEAVTVIGWSRPEVRDCCAELAK